MTVVPFPKPRTDVDVVIWEHNEQYIVTVFDWGHERHSTSFRSFEAADCLARQYCANEGASLEIKCQQTGGEP